ncbi:hypothetical protein [Blastomonas fulva]|jgi:hypothetical protein|uniref:hypothetical protein n=1 Tax=Blastomonas fulva TaxID=1550728 RepID=UPI003D2B9FFA
MKYWHGLITGAALVTAAGVLIAANGPHTMQTLDVERINIREPDGTLRLIISSKERFPGSFHKGQEIPRPDRRFAAGMLFLNDEGTENGGLIWAGNAVDGQADAGASLTFDRYENDQTLQLLQTDKGTRDTAALVISDRPATTMFASRNGVVGIDGKATGGATRLFVGKSRDRASVVMLQDENGAPRIKLKVDSNGASMIDFLDAKGTVIKSIRPDN